MDRAGLTPAYGVQVRHRHDQHALEAAEVQDPEVMAREILRVFAPYRAPGAPVPGLGPGGVPSQAAR
jgi:hypothetical protein